MFDVRLLNVVAPVPPIVCPEVPLKVTVPVPGVNVAAVAFVQFPPTVKTGTPVLVAG